MRKSLFLLLVFFTSFQLSGGYALLAVWKATPVQAHLSDKSLHQVSQKHFNPFTNLIQLIKSEESEKEQEQSLAYLPFGFQDFYSFVPVFSVENKHFLIHYAASIKGKLPARYLLHNTFRI